MTNLLLKNPFWVRRLAVLAALALCLGSAYASLHSHDADCAEHVCAVCIFSDAGGASGPALPQAAQHLNSLAAAGAAKLHVRASQTLEAHRPRAPPVS